MIPAVAFARFGLTRRHIVVAALGCALPAILGAGQLADVDIWSLEKSDRLQASVSGLSPLPIAALESLLTVPGTWCEVLFLPSPNKACRPVTSLARYLDVEVGDSNGRSAALSVMRLGVSQTTSEGGGLVARLTGEIGPYGSSEYALAARFEPAEAGTRVSLAISCRIGMSSRVALQAYYSVVSRVGFSRESERSGGRALVRGIRGMAERLAMRHYLAILAWMRATEFPLAQRAEARARFWIDAAQAYPLQLHEPPRDAYLAAKRAGP